MSSLPIDDPDFEIDENKCLCKYKGKDKRVIIPYGVVSISNKAFFNCMKVERVIIPDSTIYIGKLAFALCINLYEIEIPSSLIEIDFAAFKDCKKLREIHYKGDKQ